MRVYRSLKLSIYFQILHHLLDSQSLKSGACYKHVLLKDPSGQRLFERNVMTAQKKHVAQRRIVKKLSLLYSRSRVRYWKIYTQWDIFHIDHVTFSIYTIFCLGLYNWNRTLHVGLKIYDFYLLVLKTIFYSLAALIRKILFSPLEDKKSYLRAAVYYPLYIYKLSRSVQPVLSVTGLPKSCLLANYWANSITGKFYEFVTGMCHGPCGHQLTQGT